MLPGIPPQVTNRSRRTKVFDWTVPISVGTKPAAIQGELVWVPEEDWEPLALLAGVAGLLAIIAVIILLIRRRGGREAW